MRGVRRFPDPCLLHRPRRGRKETIRRAERWETHVLKALARASLETMLKTALMGPSRVGQGDGQGVPSVGQCHCGQSVQAADPDIPTNQPQHVLVQAEGARRDTGPAKRQLLNEDSNG